MYWCMATRAAASTVIGWREWIRLSDLHDQPIKVKVDTGARTSALHARGLRITDLAGIEVASFDLLPRQRSGRGSRTVSLPVQGYRTVKSSNGRTERRPVVRTTAELAGSTWEIELTLTSRDEMGFRMLLGRSAVRRRFLVDAGSSYLHGDPASTPTEEVQP